MSDLKERIDVLLVEKGMFETREKAQRSIMAGEIFVNGMRVDKCGEKVKKVSEIIFKGQSMKYVSRGGYKLEKAMSEFKIDLKDKVCMDIGASTGGFTDCMLQNGASKVFAIDVGYGQLAWKLRTDPRVVCMERTNVRYVKHEELGELSDFASIDVAFISLEKVVPVVLTLLKDKGQVVALIKPQFEAGRDKVGKKGVVREKSTHIEVITRIIDFLKKYDLNILGLSYSPIKGPEGNIEYLVYISKDSGNKKEFDDSIINEVVELSHSSLDK